MNLVDRLQLTDRQRYSRGISSPLKGDKVFPARIERPLETFGFSVGDYVDFTAASIPGNPPSTAVRMYHKTTGSDTDIFVRTNAGTEVELISTASASLDGAYNNGATITVDAGSVILNDATAAAANTLTLNKSGAGSGNMIDTNISAVFTGNVFDFSATAGATGNVINTVMNTAVAMTALHIEGSGVRTQPFIELIGTQTGSADMIDLSADGAFTGDMISIDMNAAVGANALFIDAGAATRTVPLLVTTFDGNGTTAGGTLWDINVSNTGAAANPLFDIDVSGVYTGNIFDVNYSAVATGNAISLVMGSNVSGMAIDITSAATGTSGEGSAYNVAHTGNLVAGVDLIRVSLPGSPSSTRNLVAIEQSTGAGTAGANALFVSATGANVTALKIGNGLLVEAVVPVATGAGNGETIDTSGNITYYDCGGASRTGVILEAGVRDGQVVRVVNVSDAVETIMFAIAGTSNVALGTSAVIEQNTAMTFVWSGSQAPAATQSLWFPLVA